MLPAGSLLKNKKTHLVAAAQKRLALRVVRAPYRVYPRFLYEVCVSRLKVIIYRSSYPRPLLMAVYSHYDKLSAVEVKFRLVLAFREAVIPVAEAFCPAVSLNAVLIYCQLSRVKIRRVYVPEPCPIKAGADNSFLYAIPCFHRYILGSRAANISVTVFYLGNKTHRSVRRALVRDYGGYVSIRAAGAYCGRGDEYIAYIQAVIDMQPHVPDNSSKDAIIHVPALRRNIRASAGIDPDSNQVVLAGRV